MLRDRELVIVEADPAGGVRILARSQDTDLLARVSAELAAIERRRLTRLERPVRLVTGDPPEGGAA
jgi:hypothetical protein